MYLADTLYLPEKVDVTGDTVILANQVIFEGRNAVIKGHHAVYFFPVITEGVLGTSLEAAIREQGDPRFSAVSYKGKTKTKLHAPPNWFVPHLLTRGWSLTINTSGKGWYEWLEEQKKNKRTIGFIKASFQEPEIINNSGQEGVLGATGDPQFGSTCNGSPEVSSKGDNGACGDTTTVSGREGFPGSNGCTGLTGNTGKIGGDGGNASPIFTTITNTSGTYHYYANGGKGGKGGKGGTGGIGGTGAQGGEGGTGLGPTALARKAVPATVDEPGQVGEAVKEEEEVREDRAGPVVGAKTLQLRTRQALQALTMNYLEEAEVSPVIKAMADRRERMVPAEYAVRKPRQIIVHHPVPQMVLPLSFLRIWATVIQAR